MNNIKTLLSQVSDISKKYEEIAKLTGENYNVFRILKLTTAEVKTHSAFIGELLNPKGCHDQGAVFLELFFESLKEKLVEKGIAFTNVFDCKNGKVSIENHIGKISENKEEGGRIDIIITDNNENAIIIENKIHASDGEKQLLRYSNYGEKKHTDKFALLYLTLYGNGASKWSTGYIEAKAESESENEISKEQDTFYTMEDPKKVDVINISYRDDILSWLEKCKEKAVNHPMLRESIAQYINLIKYLTNQTINKKMEDEIIRLFKKDINNAESAFILYENFNNIRSEIINSVLVPQLCEIAKDNELELKVENIDNQLKHWNFSFFRKDWLNFEIAFVFDTKYLRDFVYGLAKQNTETVVSEKTKDILKKHGEPAETWALWDFLNECRHWEKEEFKMIVSEKKEMKTIIEGKIRELLVISESIEM